MSQPEPLTNREREVYREIVKGRSNRQIARVLVIELNTVKNHVHSILKKLDLSSRNELIALHYTTLIADRPDSCVKCAEEPVAALQSPTRALA